MAKVAVTTFLLLRRAYTAAAENVRVGTAAVTTRKVVDSSTEMSGGEKREDTFWMRDPKTGNWIPETHFGEVDVVDLREKFLAKKATK